MSEENADAVRDSLDAYARRDIQTLRELAHPDVELDWSASRSWLAGVYRGIDESMRDRPSGAADRP